MKSAVRALAEALEVTTRLLDEALERELELRATLTKIGSEQIAARLKGISSEKRNQVQGRATTRFVGVSASEPAVEFNPWTSERGSKPELALKIEWEGVRSLHGDVPAPEARGEEGFAWCSDCEGVEVDVSVDGVEDCKLCHGLGWTGPRPVVFCGGECDWLDSLVPTEWLADLLELISSTPRLNWALPTRFESNWKDALERVVKFNKRGERPSPHMIEAWLSGTPPKNVWIGVYADKDGNVNAKIPAVVTLLNPGDRQ